MRANFRVEFVFLVESLERSEILFEESNVLLQERVAKCLEEGEREKVRGKRREGERGGGGGLNVGLKMS